MVRLMACGCAAAAVLASASAALADVTRYLVVGVETVDPVPVPAAVVLGAIGIGAVGAAGWVRRKRRQKGGQ